MSFLYVSFEEKGNYRHKKCENAKREQIDDIPMNGKEIDFPHVFMHAFSFEKNNPLKLIIFRDPRLEMPAHLDVNRSYKDVHSIHDDLNLEPKLELQFFLRS